MDDSLINHYTSLEPPHELIRATIGKRRLVGVWGNRGRAVWRAVWRGYLEGVELGRLLLVARVLLAAADAVSLVDLVDRVGVVVRAVLEHVVVARANHWNTQPKQVRSDVTTGAQ